MMGKTTAIWIGVASALALAIFMLRDDPVAAIGRDAGVDHGNSEPITPEPVSSGAKSSVAEIPEASDDFETVMGISVRKDRNCEVKKSLIDMGNGYVTEAFSCEPYAAVQDPLDNYSDADLAVMAYSDASAAQELGKRLAFSDTAGSRRMMLRAVALEPENVKPLLWLAVQTASLRGESEEAKRAVADSYVLAKTANAVAPNLSPEYDVSELKEYEFSDPELQELDRLVAGNLQFMRDIQGEVFGRATIGEVEQ